MKFFITIVFLVGSFRLSTQENRIVNGLPVYEYDMKNFSYQASLRYEKQGHICGAVILNENHLITAAHCVHLQSPSSFEVKAGSNIWSMYRHAQILKVDKIVVHPSYETDTHSNDLAVLRTKKPFKFTDKISNIGLYNETKPFLSSCVISGWGSVRTNGPLSDILRYANVTPIAYKNCHEIFPKNIFPGMMCAYDKGSGKDACNGDSGGPLVCGNKLMGIVSWGFECGIPNVPGVYTNVTHYYQWITTQSSSVFLVSSMTLNALMVFCSFCFFIR